MAAYKQAIDYSQYKNWDDLKKAIDTKNMIPTEWKGPAGPEFAPFYNNLSNQQNWGAPTDQYIPGIGRATAIDANAPDSTPDNPYDDYNPNDPYNTTNHKKPEKETTGLQFANPDREGWGYQLKPGADGSLVRTDIDLRPHGFLEKALDAAPMVLGAAMTGAGFAGMLPGAGAASAEAAGLSALPAGGMTATGTAAPWAATAAPELGSGLMGTSAADIGSLMGTSGGAFELGTGLSGITAADLAAATGGLPSSLLKNVAKELLKKSLSPSAGGSSASAGSGGGQGGIAFNAPADVTPKMLRGEAPPQQQQAVAQALMLSNPDQPKFNAQPYMQISGMQQNPQMMALAKALQTDA